MKRFIIVALSIALLACGGARADSFDPIKKRSPHNVAQTADRLERVIKAKGAMVIARVDHAANAAQVGKALRPTTLLIFGNPELGTELMQVDQRTGLDLPMKALIFEDEAGETWLLYDSPQSIAARRGVPEDIAVLAKMSEALDALTDKAIAP